MENIVENKTGGGTCKIKEKGKKWAKSEFYNMECTSTFSVFYFLKIEKVNWMKLNSEHDYLKKKKKKVQSQWDCLAIFHQFSA